MKRSRKTKKPVNPLVQLTDNVVVNPANVVSLFGHDGNVDVRMDNGVTYIIYRTTTSAVREKFSS